VTERPRQDRRRDRRETDPVYPGKLYLDWELDDPAGRPIEDVRLIRDAIVHRIEELLSSLGIHGAASSQT
jgi:protein-tyrosine-phosphatase